MNNDTIRNQYAAFARIKGFGEKHGAAFAAESRGAKLFIRVGEVVAAMEENGVQKLVGSDAFHGGTSAKAHAAGLVREDMEAIRRTAEAIAEAEDTPEFDDAFRLPRSGSYETLLTRARAFHKEAAKHEAWFIEFEMPADFLEDLDDDIKLLAKADDDQDAGLSNQVANTAALADNAAKGMKIRRQLDAVVENKFRADAATLAEWRSAQHISWPNRRKAEEPVTG
ncbi:hypothetical protein [Haloferula sargassicola]|uniref:Uncharacterized protein n=1 Tax=Haloferula sargassicola TaxID=490096 RepID=A0ABP9UQ27_9BACT